MVYQGLWRSASGDVRGGTLVNADLPILVRRLRAGEIVELHVEAKEEA